MVPGINDLLPDDVMSLTKEEADFLKHKYDKPLFELKTHFLRDLLMR